MDSKIFKVHQDTLGVEEYDRWTDPGGHDHGYRPDGPLHPTEVSGSVIVSFTENHMDWIPDFESNEPDTMHDLTREITFSDGEFEFTCTKMEAHKLWPNLYLLIPVEMEYGEYDEKVEVCNVAHEKIIERAIAKVRERGLIPEKA